MLGAVEAGLDGREVGVVVDGVRSGFVKSVAGRCWEGGVVFIFY